MEIPEHLQPILWSKDVGEMSLEQDKNYIVHQVLSYGTLDDVKWLFSVYPREEVKEVFVQYPKKLYTPAGFNFIKEFVLKVNDPAVVAENYVKTLF